MRAKALHLLSNALYEGEYFLAAISSNRMTLLAQLCH
jgi:hypothetical protein